VVPPGGGRRLLVAAVATGAVLNPLNSSMIAVALIDIQHDLGVSFADVSWTISAFYLGSAIGQPVLGRMGDIYGRRRAFLAGLSIMGAASALAPLAPTLGCLIAARVAQAVGSSAVYPAGIGIIRHSVSERQTQALGVLSIFALTSAALGPTVGAWLVGWHGWRAVFLVNVPVVATAFVLAYVALPRDARAPRRRAGDPGVARRVDVGGVGLFSATLFCLLWFLLSIEATPAWWALAAAPAALAGFVARELSAREPFIDLRALTAAPRLTFVYAQFAAVNVIFYAVYFGIPSYLQAGRAFSVQKTGLIMLVLAAIGALSVPVARRLIERRGLWPALLSGVLLLAAGSSLLLTFGDDTPTAWIVCVLAVIGVSIGFTTLGLQSELHRTAPPEGISGASGLFMTSRYVGTILSTGLLGAVFGSTIGTDQLHLAAWMLALLAGLIVLATVHSHGSSRAEARPAATATAAADRA
jgi:MFS family permease